MGDCLLCVNRKISLSTSKINIELRKTLVRSYICSIALNGSEFWTLTKLERNYLQSFKMCCCRRVEKLLGSENIINKVLQHICDNGANIHNIRSRKAIWVGHIPRINCHLLDVVEQIWETDENIGSYWIVLYCIVLYCIVLMGGHCYPMHCDLFWDLLCSPEFRYY